MKKSTQKMKRLLALFFFSLIAGISMGQTPSCTYYVGNSLNCSMSVQVDYYTGTPCTTVCDTEVKTIAAATTATYNCGSCGTLCDVKVTILVIGGTTLNPPVSVSISDLGTPLDITTSVPNSCFTSGYTVFLKWDPEISFIYEEAP